MKILNTGAMAGALLLAFGLQAGPSVSCPCCGLNPTEEIGSGLQIAGQMNDKRPSELHLTGELVEGGAECQRFRSSEGKYYTLEGKLDGFHNGDKVEITAEIAQASHCTQDTPLKVKSIRRAQNRHGSNFSY